MSKMYSQSDPVQINILTKLQTTVSSLRNLHQISAEQQTDNTALQEIAFAKIHQKHLIEIQTLKEELSNKKSYISELENQLKSQESTFMTNLKFQLTHLENIISDKETLNESLQRQILKQKQKLTQIESQLQNQKDERQFYENSFKKLIETVKGQLKQIDSINEENELTNFMSLTVFKQFTDRIEAYSSLGSENDLRKNCMKDKFMRLKRDFDRLKEKCNNLEIEKERLNEKLWTLQNGMNGNGYDKESKSKVKNENNHYVASKISKQSKTSKDEENLSFNINNMNKRFNFLNKSQKLRNLDFPSTLLLQKLDQTLNAVTQYSSDLQGIGMTLNGINTKITQEQQIWSQVLIVKDLNTKLKDELNELKQAKVNPLITDQLLRTEHPNLYNYFSKKMDQLQQFETRLQLMQRESIRVIQLIQRIMFEGIPSSITIKHTQQISKQLQQQQSIIRSKLKRELLQKFQNEKQIYKQQTQTYCVQKQQALNEEIIKLNKQIQRLMMKNQDMFKLINQMEEHQQQMQQQVEDQRNQQSLMQSSNNKKTTQQTDTQEPSKPPSPKQQIDKQFIGYIQKKTQDLQVQLNQHKELTQKYKKELKILLENYKPKSTKFKLTRCSECLLTVGDEKNSSKKCERCKIELHQGVCYKDHEVNCKKRVAITRQNQNNTKKNPGQKKRTSNQLGNSNVSQNLDYF